MAVNSISLIVRRVCGNVLREGNFYFDTYEDNIYRRLKNDPKNVPSRCTRRMKFRDKKPIIVYLREETCAFSSDCYKYLV